VGIAFSLFHLYTAGFGLLPGMQQRAIHILFGFSLTLLLRSPVGRETAARRVPIGDLLLIVLVVASCINAYLKFEWFYYNVGESTSLDIFLGSAIIVLAVETGRRMTGWVFPTLTIAMIVYVFMGPYIPGTFGHRGFSLIVLIQHLYQTTLGVFGFVTGISATIIAGFFILVGFLLHTGGGQTLIDLAIVVAGRFRGGPALVAVVASSMFATISGGPSTNVAATGSFTIPMMKRLGYRPYFAGAVEAAASTGGALTPPVMGAAAFIIAEFLDISYIKVATAAIIPALLYYTGVFSGVLFETRRQGLPAIPREEIPPWRTVITWKKLSPLFLPIAMLLFFLIRGFSPPYATFWAFLIAVALYMFSDLSLTNVKRRLKTVVYALEQAGKSLIQMTPLFVCANIVVSLITMAGLGVKLGGVIASVAGGSMLITLIMAGTIALIMGMGMPTSASYLIAIAIVGPVMESVDVLPLAGHLFVFYYAMLSNITPPVCLSVFVAAGIAGANWLRLARQTLLLAMIAYFVPFMFTYLPALLLKGEPSLVIRSVVFAVVGTFFLGCSLAGYFTSRLNVVVRVLMVGGAILLLVPGWRSGVGGMAVIATCLLGTIRATCPCGKESLMGAIPFPREIAGMGR
jgi:TRAP transporter 4TM/12TM fusion protein